MKRPARITTNFPSVLETAKRLGVSKHDAMRLAEMAERSVKTGKFAILAFDHPQAHNACDETGWTRPGKE